MTTKINGNQIQLGDDADTSKNFIISVPATPDGTLTIKRGNNSGLFQIDQNGKLSYTADNTGTYVQPNNKATSFAVNKPHGTIVTAASSLASGASVTWFCPCTIVNSKDVLVANMQAPYIHNYELKVSHDDENLYFKLTNISGGVLSEAVYIFYSLIGAKS